METLKEIILADGRVRHKLDEQGRVVISDVLANPERDVHVSQHALYDERGRVVRTINYGTIWIPNPEYIKSVTDFFYREDGSAVEVNYLPSNRKHQPSNSNNLSRPLAQLALEKFAHARQSIAHMKYSALIPLSDDGLTNFRLLLPPLTSSWIPDPIPSSFFSLDWRFRLRPSDSFYYKPQRVEGAEVVVALDRKNQPDWNTSVPVPIELITQWGLNLSPNPSLRTSLLWNPHYTK